VVARLVALLIVLAFVPAVGELIETTAHLVTHGDTGHHADDDHEGAPLGTDEHGCSPVLHLCGCHAPTPVSIRAIDVPTAVPRDVRTANARLPVDLSSLDSPAPPTRPPIA